MKKKILFIYDFTLNHTNRGCQALTYGSIAFIKNTISNSDNYEWITPGYSYKPRKDIIYNIEIDGTNTKIIKRFYFIPDIIISTLFYWIFKIPLLPTRFSKDLHRLKYTTNISGGDGFSDIYHIRTFFILTWPSIVSVASKKKLILLPQTIGPFYSKLAKMTSRYILKGAYKVFVRDLVYAKELDRLKVKYELTHDVSYYMNPKKVSFYIPENSVGINISGLMYYNSYGNLEGKFDHYKDLLIKIIESFQFLKVPIFLIPHTYNYKMPEINSDDLQASKDILNLLSNTEFVSVIDRDMSAQELKYLISQFDFFIGSRMHANFAAIYTNTLVFGLAYSYKFEGAFSFYKLKENYALVTDLADNKVDQVVGQVFSVYNDRKEQIATLNIDD